MFSQVKVEWMWIHSPSLDSVNTYMTTQQNTERFFFDETAICIPTSHPSVGLQACLLLGIKGTEERGWGCYLSPSLHLNQQQVSQTNTALKQRPKTMDRSEESWWEMFGKNSADKKLTVSLNLTEDTKTSLKKKKKSGRRRQFHHSERIKCNSKTPTFFLPFVKVKQRVPLWVNHIVYKDRHH